MPLNNFGIVCDNIYRSDLPDQHGLHDLASLGIKFILKLDADYPEETNFHDIKVIDYPLPGWIGNTTKQIINVCGKLRFLSAEGPTLVHCKHGRDRTGLVIGAYRLIYHKWTLDQVNAERAEYGVTGLIKLFDFPMNLILKEIARSL